MKNAFDEFDVVTLGERGQVVIPADVRKSLNLEAGDKLFVIHKGKKAIVLMPMNELADIKKALAKKLAVLEEVDKRRGS